MSRGVQTLLCCVMGNRTRGFKRQTCLRGKGTLFSSEHSLKLHECVKSNESIVFKVSYVHLISESTYEKGKEFVDSGQKLSWISDLDEYRSFLWEFSTLKELGLQEIKKKVNKLKSYDSGYIMPSGSEWVLTFKLLLQAKPNFTLSGSFKLSWAKRHAWCKIWSSIAFKVFKWENKTVKDVCSAFGLCHCCDLMHMFWQLLLPSSHISFPSNRHPSSFCHFLPCTHFSSTPLYSASFLFASPIFPPHCSQAHWLMLQ